MPGGKKDGAAVGGGAGRGQNGNRSNFRTDAAISNSRFGNERTLQPWVPDSNDAIDGSLEKTSSGGTWDQFAENERLFGVRTDYDENIYTTAINKNHPQYRERIAAAERKAREIERSVATTAHVAEERVMDYVGGNDKNEENEEDKYSGVRRQDFPPLGGRENKYTPPAKRAPTAHSTVKGAPIDPAIISSQIKAPAKKQSTPTAEDGKPRSAADANKNGVPPKAGTPEPTSATAVESNTDATLSTAPSSDTKLADKSVTPGPSSASGSRNLSPQVKDGTPSATSTVERDVLNSFKSFASQQRENAQKVRNSKAKADKEVKLTELKKFANSFKLSTPVPTDLVSIIAKDPSKQKEIQAKAIRNAEDVAKTKAAEVATKDKPTATKEAPTKLGSETSSTKNTPDSRAPRAPHAAQMGHQGGGNNRHANHRQQYPQQQYQHQPYRNHRGAPQHAGGQQQQPATLAQRLRNVEQQKYSQPPPQQHMAGQEGRAPPTGPANNVDPNFNRRLSGAPSAMGAKLNPTITEFRPSPFAASFSPGNQPSASSSPRSAANQVTEPPAAPSSGGQLIRRKTKAVDVKKCFILSHIKTIAPPQGRNWDENGGLRPSFDTLPTWRQLQDNEKPDSTMHLTYKEFFERQPFSGSSMPTPNPPHVVPHMAHQHQLPFHLQQGGHNIGPRQSPHMPHMQMHTSQHGPGPHQPYNHDDHRMVHSNSAQSFASPRLGQASMAYPGMNSPAQGPYNQPVYMGPGTPQMGQFRSFSNNPQYMSPQQGPMMMQPQFMPGPQGMVGGPQMMYPGGHPHFMPPGGPPQPGPGANGYPSPGRPAAPMMAHQGSQQGHQMYGMSPSVQYSQPAYGPGQQPGGPMSHPRGYSGAGPQHFGTSPQQAHQHTAHHQQRSGSNSYNRNHSAQGQQQQQQHQAQQQQPPATPQANQAAKPATSQNKGTDGSDEAK